MYVKMVCTIHGGSLSLKWIKRCGIQGTIQDLVRQRPDSTVKPSVRTETQNTRGQCRLSGPWIHPQGPGSGPAISRPKRLVSSMSNVTRSKLLRVGLCWTKSHFESDLVLSVDSLRSYLDTESESSARKMISYLVPSERLANLNLSVCPI